MDASNKVQEATVCDITKIGANLHKIQDMAETSKKSECDKTPIKIPKVLIVNRDCEDKLHKGEIPNVGLGTQNNKC